MKRRHYMTMTDRQAAAAFDEHLAERPAALEHLRAELTADAQDANGLLDGSRESLTPLWRWLAERILAAGELDVPFDPDPPAAPEHWPGWARYGGLRQSIPDSTVALLDGFISYVEDAVLRGAPGSARTLVKHRVKRYYAQNNPGFTGPSGALSTPAFSMVSVMANQVLRGQPIVDAEFTAYAGAMIDTLTEKPHALPAEQEPEPLVEIVLEDGEFDVSLREDVAHEHSRAIDRMVKELRALPAVRAAHREDHEVLLVRAPAWSTDDLHSWLAEWLERHSIPAG